MKTLITLLAITFSANSFAHGFYLSPSQQVTLSPFFGTSFTALSFEGTSKLSGVQKALQAVVMDAQEYRQSGNMTVALEESVKNVQAEQDVSVEEAVDILSSMAEEILN